MTHPGPPRPARTTSLRRARARAIAALLTTAALGVHGCASMRAQGDAPVASAPSVHANVCPPTEPPRGGGGAHPAMDDSDAIPVAGAPVEGPADALVTIVEFSDFQCPYCARVESTLAAVMHRYGPDVRLVFRHYPLSSHPNALQAAEAARAAQAQGQFWPMHAMLFQHQHALARADLERYAQVIGLDLVRFRHDLDAHTFLQDVRADMALAARLEVNGAPSFFINGTNLPGAARFDRFAAVIDRVLARARAITPRERVYAAMAADPLPLPAAPPAPPPVVAQRPPELDMDAVHRVPIDGAPAQGPADALVTVVEFSDFQCPYCARVQPTLAELRRRYGNDLRVVFRNEPLENHPDALPAAEAAQEVFAQQGAAGFFRYHDALFAHRDGLDRAHLEAYARAQGVNLARLRTALDQHTHAARIQADVALAQRLGADGTPYFFVNGRRVEGAVPLEDFVVAIDRARAEAQRAVQAGAPRAEVYERLTGNGAEAPVFRPGTAPAAPP